MRVAFADLPQFSSHVLVDGAFDPIHAGHIAYLTAARQLNRGPLLCAVASDDQIREKGREPFLPQESRVAVLEALCDAVYAKDRPTEDVIRQMRPTAYVKGADWRNRLPDGQLLVCAENGLDVVHVYTPLDSSTARLRAWALKDAEQSLERLEAAEHAPAVSAPFDREYFEGEWRAEGNVYTYEKRKEIEGKHPELIKECFPQLSILDVGCGPGFLVRMLKEIGVDAGGCDPSQAAVDMAASKTVVRMLPGQIPDRIADVAICREVLEHVPVLEIPALVADLFRVAREFVYITTRFSQGAIFDCATEFDVDPTHITLLTQPFLRSLCVLNGGKRRRDLEATLDHMNKGRCLVYEL